MAVHLAVAGDVFDGVFDGVLFCGVRFPTRCFGRYLGWLVGRLVVCFGLNGLLRQYSSLYRAVSQTEGERKKK